MNRKYVITTIALALLLFAAFAVSFQGTANAAQPQPLYAPTPVSVTHPGIRSAPVTFFASSVITADGNSTAQQIADHSAMDLQVVFDQTIVAAAGNTTTLTLQFSNDGVNWVDGPAVATANAVDANDMQQYAIFGRFARVNANVSNANPVTVSVVGLAK